MAISINENVDMTVGTSYTAVGQALSAGSADIGFISGGNYVLFSDDCDVLLTALRYAFLMHLQHQ